MSRCEVSSTTITVDFFSVSRIFSFPVTVSFLTYCMKKITHIEIESGAHKAVPLSLMRIILFQRSMILQAHAAP